MLPSWILVKDFVQRGGFSYISSKIFKARTLSIYSQIPQKNNIIQKVYNPTGTWIPLQNSGCLSRHVGAFVDVWMPH